MFILLVSRNFLLFKEIEIRELDLFMERIMLDFYMLMLVSRECISFL